MSAHRALARVNVAAIERNCARLRRELRAGVQLCAVVKADGYGHGASVSARAALAGGATMPSYRRMVAAEGVADPVDVALIGDEVTLGERLARLEAAGATELMANVVGTPEERVRTRAFLASRS